MNYPEYKESVKTVTISEKLEFRQAIMWLHPYRLPLGLVSIGGEKSPVIKVPETAINRYGNAAPVIVISGTVFAGNKGITDIILPSGVESLPAGSFAGCSSLRRITIPRRIKTIREGTFAGCLNLEDVYYEGTMEDWRDIRIIHDRHEIEFGPLIPGTPVQSILSERSVNIPGNEALFSANIHFRCELDDDYNSSFMINACGKDITNYFRTM